MISSMIWCVIGIVGGAIFSFIISYYFYKKSLNRKRLIYDIKTICIISNKISQIQGLVVKYNSSEIDNLNCSTVTIKNIGNSIIKMQDLAPSCPISVFSSGQILNTKTYCIESHPVNKITNYSLLFVEKNGICNCIEFNFDYIPKKAIITFSLFHIGDITFKGDLMDGEIKPVGNSTGIKPDFFYRLSCVFAFITGLLGAILATLFFAL